jgi:hypothetical protein
MASNTQIRCVCGATLSTAIPELILNFDAIHGTLQHQNAALQIEKERNEIGKVKWGMNK